MPVLNSIEDAPSFVAAMPIVYPLERLTRDCATILDVGCGSRSPLRFVKGRAHRVGFDGYQPSIDEAARRSIHHEYICSTIEGLASLDRRFDAVIALEIIEHLPKEQGIPFVRQLERLASKIVILSTPNGFLPTPTQEANPYQQHLSGWTPEEFRALGYTVRGLSGVKRIRGEAGKVVLRPAAFWWPVSKLTEPLVWKQPDRAFGLLCYKRLG